jgi:Uma2 family endonuclease
MSVQAKHRFTVNDYYRMAEVGVLKPDARVELLNGEIIDMSPIGPFHGWIVNRLNDFFAQNAKGRWMVSPQNPLRLDDHSQPQPDIMLVKRTNDYPKRHPVPGDVLLLIEVSDTTLELDRSEKLPAYGRAGIKEVWIVNLVDEVIEVYREPHFTGYGSKTILQTGDTAQPLAFPDVSIKLAELLKR